MSRRQARPTTHASYRKRAKALITAARRLDGDMLIIEKLAVILRDRPDLLARNSAGVYRQAALAAVDLLIEEGVVDSQERDRARSALTQAISEVIGTPKVLRTSALKVLDATLREARQVLKFLKARALSVPTSGRCQDAFLGLIIFLSPRIGWRPSEIEQGQLDNATLILATKKLSSHGATLRRMTLDNHDLTLDAMRVLLSNLQFGMSPYAHFDAWIRALSERLARACVQCGIRRLCLYSFRHVAVCNWRAAGFSLEEIKALLGHTSMRSQQFYGRKSKPWKTAVVVTPVKSEVELVEKQMLDQGADREKLVCDKSGADPKFDFEPMPQPTPKQSKTDSADIWLNYMRSQLKPLPGARGASRTSLESKTTSNGRATSDEKESVNPPAPLKPM